MAASSKNKVVCMNCGREISSTRAAISDGWIISPEEGTAFCCCVCVSEYRNKQAKPKRKKNS